MQLQRYQRGMSIPGILIILIMVGFFVMCAIRMSPPYFEYLSVKKIVEGIVVDPEFETASVGDIRRRLDNTFNSNQIYELEAKAVEVYRKEGKTYIDASYEVRVPIMGRIDAMLKFDDLLYTLGEPEPLEPGSVVRR